MEFQVRSSFKGMMVISSQRRNGGIADYKVDL